ncbi:MAG TPA: hypothetical protein VFE62_16615, partial [Gemmataceae bacterium]|nr:hypothetical protein [Gemmataceae bacterium]
SDGSATLPATVAVKNGVGSFNVIFRTSGTQTITASSGAISAVSNNIAVSTAATHYNVQLASMTVGAGASVTFAVTALDASENVATGYTGMVLFSSSDPKATFGVNKVKLTHGVGTFSVILKTIGDQTITASDFSNHSITGTSTSTVTVTAGAATKFAITGAPPSATAGIGFTFTVAAQDIFGNTADSYSGTVTFSSSDTRLSTLLPADATLIDGVGTFSATLTSAGTRSITARDTLNGTITGTKNITVVGAAATNLSISVPQNAIAGTPFTVTVTGKDEFGNGANTTLDLFTDDPLANMPTITLVNGIATFTVTLQSAGTFTISATDLTTGATTTSNGITVTINKLVR